MIFGSLGATGRVLALAGTVVSAAVALVTLSAAPAQPSPTIEWDGRLLTVTAEQVPLHDVLQGVARRTGVAFGGTEPLQEDVSFHFSGLPFGEALKRLTAGFNHVVVEERTPGGEIRPVRVLFLSGVDSTYERQDELAAMAESKTGPSQTEAERAEVTLASRRLAARVLLDQADAEALPPGLSRNHLLLQLERGLARQVELDHQLEIAASRAAGGKNAEE